MKRTCVVLPLLVAMTFWCTAKADVIWNVRFNPAPYCAMKTGDYVTITFDYRITTPGGVRIFPRPFTDGALTPAYGASPSGIYTGSGTGTSSFTIMTGNVVVDHVRFEVLSSDQSQKILEFFVPAEYHYGADGVYNIQVTPASPSSMELDRRVDIAFTYNVSTPGGIQIFPRPFTNGQLTPDYAASPSPAYTGSGSETGAHFTITTGEPVVDQIRFQMLSQSQVVKEFFVPVNYSYAAHSISSIVITPTSPEGLLHGQNVSVTFSYYTTEPTGVRIFARPFTDGGLTPSYSAHASPLYPAGSGTGTGSFTITSGSANVDSIRFEMYDAAQTKLLMRYFVPVNFYFAGAKMSNVQFYPTSPAYFTIGERDTVRFSYTHSLVPSALMWALPFSGADYPPHFSYQGSIQIPGGSGDLTRHFTITSGNVHVDAVILLMRDSANAVDHVQWNIPSDFWFGSQTLTGTMDAGERPATFALDQNYPNPFNPSTTITFELAHSSPATLTVYDVLGREAAALVNDVLEAGRHTVAFDGARLASGVYLYRLRAGDFVSTKKMILLR